MISNEGKRSTFGLKPEGEEYQTTLNKMNRRQKVISNLPYKLTVYLLLLQLEKHHHKQQKQRETRQLNRISEQIAEQHAFFGTVLMALIQRESLSAATVKCFAQHFVTPLAPSVVELFHDAIKGIEKNSALPLFLFGANRWQPSDEGSANPNFFEPNSIIGEFVGNVQQSFDGLDLGLHKEWIRYLNGKMPDSERAMMDGWGWNVDKLLTDAQDIEKKYGKTNERVH
ncbi:hypothetical protein DdX_14152 [Ditylenchus destructor]|uniref:Uncharacterized protein n=1 Tax=Ditylenchus destructor TaxID=166010 RepID=A0AAD4MXN7_9BILA|nr:hypothetical protein DdX_14152 [Ditylenchus destructor]